MRILVPTLWTFSPGIPADTLPARRGESAASARRSVQQVTGTECAMLVAGPLPEAGIRLSQPAMEGSRGAVRPRGLRARGVGLTRFVSRGLQANVPGRVGVTATGVCLAEGRPFSARGQLELLPDVRRKRGTRGGPSHPLQSRQGLSESKPPIPMVPQACPPRLALRPPLPGPHPQAWALLPQNDGSVVIK